MCQGMECVSGNFLRNFGGNFEVRMDLIKNLRCNVIGHRLMAKTVTNLTDS